MNQHASNGKLQIALIFFTLLAPVMAPCPKAIGADETARVEGKMQTLELGSPFVDNAILQRDMPVPVWGWAKPGSEVSVTFGVQTKTTTADTRGKWRISLDPLKASLEERELTVTIPEGQSLTRTGVLVGEVWFASGQSNMDWIASKSMCRDLANQLQRSKEDIPVREYNAELGSSLFLCSRVASEQGWKKAGQAGSFSALSLAFAWDLYQTLKVPIGIVRSTHGATPIETWIPYEGVAPHPKLQNIALRIRQSDPTTQESKEAYQTYFDDLRRWQIESEKIITQGGDALPRPTLPGIADDWKGATRMYNFKIAPLVPYAIRGMIWCQGTHNANDGKIYAAKMEALLNGLRQNWGKPDLPFYFTQMQCYGEANPDQIGFADIREAQTLFFMNNAHVGMVAQYDLNSARPTGIHNFNKLDPGKRLARWALAHEYGRDMAYCGPIFKSYTVKGHSVRVQFEQRGPGGGLMVASKGMQVDMKDDPHAYVEPAKETPGQALTHFRLCARDRVWHTADAHIEGNEVVVMSQAVPNPIGVQYAYSASPIGANLYNRAGLPATPFAYVHGKQFFKEDDPELVAAEKAEAERRYSRKPFLLPSSLLRDHAVIQRDISVPIWGHGVPGTEITVAFGGQTQKTTVGRYEKWRVRLDPMLAASQGRDLEITASDGDKRTIKDVVVGDVWIMTGAQKLTRELVVARWDPAVERPQALPLLREFRLKTNARRFRTPRKRRLEIGGGKYVASWRPAVFDESNHDTSVAAYHFASRVARPNVPIGIVTLGADNPPITWVSYASMQTAEGFERQRDDLNLAYPNTKACKEAVVTYVETVKQYNRDVAALLMADKTLPADMALQAPAFPQSYYNQWSNETETATHTYNFCISPITPYAVRAVVWIPGPKNIGQDVSQYAVALKTYANSLVETYGQGRVLFVYAHPTEELVEGITEPRIQHGMRVDLQAWPQGLRETAVRLGALVSER